MRITLILTGKTKAKYLQEGIEEYFQRIEHYVPFSVQLIPDLKANKKMEQDRIKRMEGSMILQRIKPADYLILLDEQGKSFSSEGFASHLSKLDARTGHVVFVIGGAYGFSEEVYKRATEKMSLSRMTFSHQMVRLIFAEQLYRAFTIQKGEPYHHK